MALRDRGFTNGGLTVNGLNEFDYRLAPRRRVLAERAQPRPLRLCATHRGHLVNHTSIRDFCAIDDADSAPVGEMTIHGGFTVVFDDANENSSQIPGEISSQHDFFRLRCRYRDSAASLSSTPRAAARET